MVASFRQSLIASRPVWGAAAAGALVGIGVVAAPAAWLETMASATGVTDLLPAAAPPLGATARAVLALLGGGVTAAIAWAMLFLVWGPGGWLATRTPSADGVPLVRRADAHPDAPPRRPLTAAELGAPRSSEPSVVSAADALPLPSPAAAMTTPPVEALLPADLDQPLAAFDPSSILAAPREPLRPVPSLAPGERLQTFQLTPPPPAPAEPPTIEALLRRLEQGAGRRAAGAR